MDKLLGIQILGIMFGCFLLYLTYLNLKRNQLNATESGFWMVIWLGLIVSSIFPNMLKFLVEDVLDVARTLDFLIIIGFMIMFGVVFYIFITTKKTQNKVEDLVRNIALRNKK